MLVNITPEFVRHLLDQITSQTATVDAQTQLIAQLNQTIQELKEQLNKNSKTVLNRLPATG